MTLRCKRRFRVGWKCIREEHISGPCALVPCWWNISARLRGF